jgi:hypothetical protein
MWEKLKRYKDAVSQGWLPPHVGNRPYMQTEVAFICKMYEDGVDVNEIAERFSRSPRSIRNKVYAMGVRRSKEHISQVRRLSRLGG